MTRNNIIAISWFILSLFISVTNDATTKFLNGSTSAVVVSFWRFVFSTIVLLPIVFVFGLKSIKTSKIYYHALRGFLLAIAISLWAYGIKFVPISTVTLMSFTIPMFTVIMACVFLRERVSFSTIIATTIGFIGSIIALSPKSIAFSWNATIFLVASIFFATLDILNKKLINERENILPMMFFSNLFSAIFTVFIPGAIHSVFEITVKELSILIVLGIGANLILFCIIKAFEKANAAFLAPIRYLELIISTIIGFIFFEENLSINIVIGGSLVILSSILIDRRYDKKKSIC